LSTLLRPKEVREATAATVDREAQNSTEQNRTEQKSTLANCAYAIYYHPGRSSPPLGKGCNYLATGLHATIS
jgi:hypothetical protein